MVSALFHGASIIPLIDLIIVIDSRYVFMQFEVLLFVVVITIIARFYDFMTYLVPLFLSSLILTAFVGTSLAFACFSAVALAVRHREYLYIGGLLSSGLSILIWLHFASSVFKSIPPMAHSICVYSDT